MCQLEGNELSWNRVSVHERQHHTAFRLTTGVDGMTPHLLLRFFSVLVAAPLLFLSGCGAGGGHDPASGAPPSSPASGVRLPGLNGPMGVATQYFLGQERLLVLEEDTGELSRVNLDTGEIELIAVGLSQPHAIVLEPESDRHTALVTESTGLSRVDLDSGTVTRLTPLSRPTALLIDQTHSDSVVVVTDGILYHIQRARGTVNSMLTDGGFTNARGIVREGPGVVLVAAGDSMGGRLVRVNLVDRTVATVIPDSTALRLPFGLEFGVEGLILTAQLSNTLVRLAGLQSDTPTTDIHVEGLKHPTGLAHLSDGRLAIAQHATNDLVILDPACARPPCPAPAPSVAGLGAPGDLAIEPGAETVLVLERNTLDAAPSAGALSRVHPKTGTVTAIASGFAAPEALALVGRTAYVAERGDVANTASGKIRRVDVTSGAVSDLPTPPLSVPSGLAVADSSTLIVAERTGSLARVNSADGQTVRLPLGAVTPVGIATTTAADGTHAYLTDESAGTLFKVSHVTACNPCGVEPIAGGLPNASGVAIEPSGASVLVVTDTGGATGGAVVRVFLPGPSVPSAPIVIAKALSHPRRIVIEAGGATALVTETNPDGIRRIALPAP